MHKTILPHWTAWIERRDAVIRIANRITQDEMLFQPSPTTWSVKDVIHHLQIVDFNFGRSAQKRLPTILDKAPVGPQSEEALQGLMKRLREFGKFDALAAINPTLMDERPSWHVLQQQWARNGVVWVQILTELPDAALDRPLTRHPRVGELRADQFLRWNSAHYDNHIAQIESILRQFGERHLN